MSFCFSRSRTPFAAASITSRTLTGERLSSKVPASMRGEIENVVDQGAQCQPRRQDVVQIFALLVGERTEGGRCQQLGKAEDRVERRAELVGDVGDEGAS